MKEKMKAEALTRLEELCDEMGLNPKVFDYFNKGKLYYSYLTAGGYMGSIDTINYDKRYADAVKAIEKETGALVYHVIETQSQFFNKTYSGAVEITDNETSIMYCPVAETKDRNVTLLALLFVSKYEEDWETEHLDDNMIYAYVCCPDSPLDYEVSTIVLSSKQGALIRIG
jgi:hypothetical protein